MTQPFDPIRMSVPSHGAAPTVLQLLPAGVTRDCTAHVLSLVRGLVADGTEVLTAVASRQDAMALRRAGAEVMIWDPVAGKRGIAALAERVGDRPDLVHAHSLSLIDPMRRLAELAGAQTAMTVHDAELPTTRLGRARLKWRLRQSALFALSRDGARRIAAATGRAAAAVPVLPAGLDMAAFDPAAVSAARTVALAERCGLVEDARPVILVPGAHREAHWLRDVLEAAAALPASDAVWLLAAEDGDRSADMAQLMVQAGLSDRMRWIDASGDWPAALKLASLMVDPGDPRRMLSRAALEAQAFGKPVLLADSGSADDCLPANHRHRLVPPADHSALAKAVAAALAEPASEVEQRRIEARLFVATRHGADALHDRMRAQYASALTAA